MVKSTCRYLFCHGQLGNTYNSTNVDRLPIRQKLARSTNADYQSLMTTQEKDVTQLAAIM